MPIYCVHKPVQLVESIKMISPSGEEYSLTQESLAARYGISLDPDGFDPFMTVFNEDLNLIDFSFMIVLA